MKIKGIQTVDHLSGCNGYRLKPYSSLYRDSKMQITTSKVCTEKCLMHDNA